MTKAKENASPREANGQDHKSESNSAQNRGDSPSWALDGKPDHQADQRRIDAELRRVEIQ